jgi:uncharacterized protein (DUF885 family)
LPSTSVIDASLASMRALLLGAPFQPEQNDSRILAAFGRKLELCTALTPEQRLNRLAHASSILRENFQPAWRSLIKTLESLRELAGQDEGTWRFPDGDEYYAYCLRRATASTLDPEEVHRDSMAEVRLVQEEIRTLKNRLGFAGSLNAFFDHLRSDAGLYGTDDPASRADLLERMRTWMRGMQPSLGEVIRESELAPLELRALSVSFAPAGSGSLYTVGPQGATAILRVDLSSPRRMPIHELEARTYGATIPGRHLFDAHLRSERPNPLAQSHAASSAFLAGWAAYAEGLAKEMGFYSAPYSDLGRLTRHLARAADAVIDTGIHGRHWTSRQAVDYVLRNTSCTEEEAASRAESCLTRPGHAVAAWWARGQILELRASATRRLGSRFDLAGFHENLIQGSRLPWPVLAQRVAAWSPALPR